MANEKPQGTATEAGQSTNGKCPVIHGAMHNPVAGRGMRITTGGPGGSIAPSCTSANQ